MPVQTESDPLLENGENRNRQWTRNPFTSLRYILLLFFVFVILTALMTAIFTYFLNVEPQSERMGQLEQQIVQVQVQNAKCSLKSII